MKPTDLQRDIEEEWDKPITDVLAELYVERGLSQTEVANELDVPRPTVQVWLQDSPVEMRSRTLSDVQRLSIMALLSSSLGVRAIADRADCHPVTVRRYRQDIVESGDPVDLDMTLSEQDRARLMAMVERGKAIRGSADAVDAEREHSQPTTQQSNSD